MPVTPLLPFSILDYKKVILNTIKALDCITHELPGENLSYCDKML